MKKKNSNAKLIVVMVIICVIFAGIFVFGILTSGGAKNKPNATGNTTGNLYNGGMVCEYDGYIYIADPTRGNTLYRMKPDGSKAKLISNDNVSYINIHNGYIYYKRHNSRTNINEIFKGNLYGIYRIKTNGSQIEELYRGAVGNMVTLAGNNLYYLQYDNQNYHLAKVDVNGEKSKVLVKNTTVLPACVFKEKIYYAELKGNHNIMTLDIKDDVISTYMEGNVYLPDIYDGYIYYIDLDNERALTKKNIATGETRVLSGEDKVINYNLCGDKEVIFYQAENGSNHSLKKTDLTGLFSDVVMDGDFKNISITSEYTYFVKISESSEDVLYRVKTKGSGFPKVFNIKAD